MHFKYILAFVCLLVLAIGDGSGIQYRLEGQSMQQFSSLLNKFPISALARVAENMDNDSEMILRPFNFGGTKNYLEHNGLGKNTNVKGKSCYLNDETLNGKITYIQTNEYTGRNRDPADFIHIGKYITKDKVINDALNKLAKQKCSQWKSKSIEGIKQDLTAAIKDQARDNKELQDILQYANARFMWKVNIHDKPYLTTEFVTTADIESNSDVPVTEEVCQQNQKGKTECEYEFPGGTTNTVKVLAYNAFNFQSCEVETFQLVADMDIMTIHFPKANSGEKVDLKKYYGPERSKYCGESFKMAFGISPKVDLVYNYVEKLMEQTAQWGLIRHSIEALNFCFTQPFETQKYYLKLSKSILGKKTITVIYEGKETQIIPDTVREWVLKGECTPLNPSWVFQDSNNEESILWNDEERQSILQSEKFKGHIDDCPTYDVIEMIKRQGGQLPLNFAAHLSSKIHLRSYHN